MSVKERPIQLATRAFVRTPEDLEEAYAEWGCNCGPAAVAAVLGLDCAAVRAHFPDFARRKYANPTHVRLALRALGRTPRSVPHRPALGLLFIQWGGPWLRPGVPIAAAYQRTHWIAVNGEAVFDVNAGDWISRADWDAPGDGVAAWILKHVPGNDGTWSIRTALELEAAGR